MVVNTSLWNGEDMMMAVIACVQYDRFIVWRSIGTSVSSWWSRVRAAAAPGAGCAAPPPGQVYVQQLCRSWCRSLTSECSGQGWRPSSVATPVDWPVKSVLSKINLLEKKKKQIYRRSNFKCRQLFQLCPNPAGSNKIR